MATYTGDDKRLQYLFTHGGGGGGSTVSITPTLQSGTKIADYEIDGNAGELYAPNGGGGSANIWTGTQAEYEQQASQIPDDTLVNITDDEQQTVVASYDIYSLEEREVGVYVDGKPLYQKSWLLTIPNASAMHQFTEVAIPNLEKVVAHDFIILPNGEGGYTPWYNSATVLFSTQTATYAQFYFASTAYAGSTLLYTAKYTKTTDNAGAGVWTPSGAYAERYSTEEQVVGTWIDGKTVYRKVIDIGSLPNATVKYVSHGISSIDTLIHAEILTSNSLKDIFFPVPYTVIGAPYINYQTNFIVTDTDIGIECGTDRSGFSGYAILEYTKATS